MLSLSNRKKVIEQGELSFMEKLYLPVIAKGLGITVKHLLKRKVTIKYPEQKRSFAKIYRGLHVLKRDERIAPLVACVQLLVRLKRLQ